MAGGSQASTRVELVRKGEAKACLEVSGSDTETMRPMELVYGVVREPAAPRYGHQSQLTRLAARLTAHVDLNGLGEVCVSPVDVVLDAGRSLVVQPDISFVTRARTRGALVSSGRSAT